MQALETAILNKNHNEVSNIICRERLYLFSIVYRDGEGVLLVKTLRYAKIVARRLCKTTRKRVVINSHDPFDYWRKYISVYYGEKRLHWHYLHSLALMVKNV